MPKSNDNCFGIFSSFLSFFSKSFLLFVFSSFIEVFLFFLIIFLDAFLNDIKILLNLSLSINSKFYLPFILGYFDGDGSIFETNQKSFGISIEGTKEMLEWINSILNISSHLEKRKQDNSNNYFIRCGGINKPYLIMK